MNNDGGLGFLGIFLGHIGFGLYVILFDSTASYPGLAISWFFVAFGAFGILGFMISLAMGRWLRKKESD